MPSVTHLFDMKKEVRESGLPKEVHDLVLGSGDSNAGTMARAYRAIGDVIGSIELAYLRGYAVGFAAGKKKRK